MQHKLLMGGVDYLFLPERNCAFRILVTVLAHSKVNPKTGSVFKNPQGTRLFHKQE